MQCNQCGGQYISKHGDLEMTDAYVGPFAVKAVEYLACEGCGDLAYSPKTILEIEKARKLALEEKLQFFPLKDFVSVAEAASMLGISRQALHKHRRIRRGFIFQTRFSDKTVYLGRSVELFKETGNGRFPLVVPENKIQYTPKQTTTSFFCGAALPEGLKEEARMMIPVESLKRMIDVLCRQCDHFPAKPKPKPEISIKPA